MERDSPVAGPSESLAASSVAGSDFDGLSDTTAATPYSSCEGSTGDGPPSGLEDIKVEENDDEDVFMTHDTDFKSECSFAIRRYHASSDNCLQTFG